MNILNSGRFSMGSASAGMIKKLIGEWIGCSGLLDAMGKKNLICVRYIIVLVQYSNISLDQNIPSVSHNILWCI